MPAVSQSKFVLDEIGDQFAERGTRSWAIYFVGQAKTIRSRLDFEADLLNRVLGTLREGEAWKPLGLASFDMLCERELRIAHDEMQAIQTAKRGQTIGEVLALRPNGTNRFTNDSPNTNENIRAIDQYGTAATYRLAKLKRDAPEIAERFEAGEFPNVREAERAAGLPVPPKLTPLEKIQRAFLRLDAGDQAEFIFWIANRS